MKNRKTEASVTQISLMLVGILLLVTGVHVSNHHENSGHLLISISTGFALVLYFNCSRRHDMHLHYLSIAIVTLYQFDFNVVHGGVCLAQKILAGNATSAETRNYMVSFDWNGPVLIPLTDANVHLYRTIVGVFLGFIICIENALLLKDNPVSAERRDTEEEGEEDDEFTPNDDLADMANDSWFRDYYQPVGNCIFCMFVFVPIRGTGLYSMISDVVVLAEEQRDQNIIVVGWMALTFAMLLVWWRFAVSENKKQTLHPKLKLVHPICKCVSLLYMSEWWWGVFLLLTFINHRVFIKKKTY